MVLRIGVGVVVVVGLVVAVVSSVQQSRQLLAANDICSATAVVWSDVEAITSIDAKKVAVECACTRATASDVSVCVEHLVSLVDELASWDLNVDVARVAAAYLADDGRWPIARQFVEAGLRQEPGHVGLNALWLDVEQGRPERERLQELQQRAVDAPHRDQLLRLVASRARRAGDHAMCLEATNTASGASDVDFLVLRSSCLAVAGRRADVVKLWDAWIASGNSRFIANAYRASILMSEHVGTSEDVATLQALERDPGDVPPDIQQKLLYVLLAYASKQPELSAYVEEVVERSRKSGAIDPEMLESFAGDSSDQGDGIALFYVPNESHATVYVSADRVDAAFTPVVAVAGVARVPFHTSEVPLRYVVRSATGVVGSGSVSRRTAGEKRVEVVEQAPTATPTFALTSRPADGHRRLFVFIPDSWDWRLLNALRARGEMPAIEAMIAAGVSGAVWSEPALTSSAMTSLAHPDIDASFGVVALLHEMGGELGGLASIGSNPLEVLSPWLPQRADLFATVGAGQHSIANLLFSHADIDAGRHAVRTGPNGKVTDVPVGRSVRPLNAEERAIAPRANEHASHFETTVAQLDLLANLIDAGTDDVILLRAEAVDLLTHARLHETANGRQDNAESSLYSMYRLIDFHLRKLLGRIDADDVFIVMSDHGALTNMQHDNHAVFVAVGMGRGQLEGEPHLRGLPRLLTDLLGIPTDFPDIGFARVLPATGTAETASGP
jgi:hypothetical protein